MGYDLYITRATSWLDAEGAPIATAEWGEVVAADPELRISTQYHYERRHNGIIERYHPAIWIKHPDEVPFWHMDGAIHVKNPDKQTTQKMVQLAIKLSARVLGESDEEYGLNGEPI